jgi:rhamnose transport system ATP-binding protein
MATGGSQTNRRERDQECRPDLKGRELLRVEGLGLSGVFDDISFSVHKEEVVCLAGLVGAGRTEIAKTIFGITPPSHGKVFMQGREIAVRNPRQMLGAGIAYLPEARDLEGLISELPILKNIVLPSIRKIATAGVVSKRREEAIGKRYSASLQIKAANLEDSVSSLSGGNRQKVVISKWLAIDPMVLILDEPTHGIDVGTKAQVHQMMFELADRGIGILMISSDLPEVLRMSDRILVISDGRLAAEFSREEANPVDIMIAAATGKAGT